MSCFYGVTFSLPGFWILQILAAYCKRQMATQTQKNADTHSRLERDSNQRCQSSSARRQYKHAGPLRSVNSSLTNFRLSKRYKIKNRNDPTKHAYKRQQVRLWHTTSLATKQTWILCIESAFSGAETPFWNIIWRFKYMTVEIHVLGDITKKWDLGTRKDF
jgi:hypothetical protein